MGIGRDGDRTFDFDYAWTLTTTSDSVPSYVNDPIR